MLTESTHIPAEALLPGGQIIAFPTQSKPQVRTMNEVEVEAIENAIAVYKGNLTEAAKGLRIGRATLYRKLKEYDINPRLTKPLKAA
jgi:DNA-binding NtrC family response regulator